MTDIPSGKFTAWSDFQFRPAWVKLQSDIMRFCELLHDETIERYIIDRWPHEDLGIYSGVFLGRKNKRQNHPSKKRGKTWPFWGGRLETGLEFNFSQNKRATISFVTPCFYLGWVTGIEPATSWATTGNPLFTSLYLPLLKLLSITSFFKYLFPWLYLKLL